MSSEESGTKSNSSDTDSIVGLFIEGMMASFAGSEWPEHGGARFACDRGAKTVNAPSQVAKKRLLDDYVAEPQFKLLKKLRKSTTSCPSEDTSENAESHFAADGDRSGLPSNKKLGTWKSSKGIELETAVRSSKTIISELEVRYFEEEIGCPFRVLSGVDCNWVGSQSGLIGHSSKSHGAKEQEESGPFVVELQNVSKSRSFHKAIVICGNLFYLLWVKKEDTMHFLVYGIPKQVTEEYTYDFKLKKGQEEISITGGICSSFLQPQCEGVEKGDIIRLHDHKVQKYLGTKDNLSCIIEIRRQKGNPPSGKADNARVHQNEVSVALRKEWRKNAGSKTSTYAVKTTNGLSRTRRVKTH